MFAVQDGTRTLKFEGVSLAQASSFSPDKLRWVEFELFKTARGLYVLSRIGKSVVYHHATCPIVRRNNIDPVPADVVSLNMEPCDRCRPTREDELLYPESSRKWAQVSDSSAGVVESLKQVDRFGTEYLTEVAKELLIKASRVDEKISSAYYVEFID